MRCAPSARLCLRLSRLGPALLLGGCASALPSEATTAFEQARYADACAALRATGVCQADAPTDTRLRCDLYRGLAELALGHHARARAPLERVKSAALHAPGRLTAHERTMLASAWRSLGLMPQIALIPVRPRVDEATTEDATVTDRSP